MGSRITRRSRSVYLGAFVIALAVLAVGCGGSSDTNGSGSGTGDTTPANGAVKLTEYEVASSTAPKSGGKLVYALEAESDGLNPVSNRFAASGTLEAMAIFDALSAWDADLKVQPYLAESFTPASDFKAWAVKLRPNVKFQNGSPLNAAAVKKFIDAFRASALTGAAAKPITAVDVVDELTVKITVDTPWVAFPASLTGQAGFIPAPEMLDDPNGSRNPIGTGPFSFVDWVPDAKLRTKKNTNYWRAGLPYLDEVEFRPTADNDARINGLKAQDFNILHTSDNKTINTLTELAKDGRVQMWRGKGEVEESLILINTEKPPMNDIRIRQAMAYSIDRTQLDSITESDPAQAADSMFQKDSKWYADTGYPAYDPEKAKQLVEAYTKEKGPVSFTLISTTPPAVQQVAQFLGQSWAAAGMDVKLSTTEQTTLIQNALTGQYQAQVWRQFGAQDPDGDYVWFASANADGPLALNMARNRDPQVDAALSKGRGSPDEATRKQAYTDLQKRFTADLPYIYLSHTPWAVVADLSVRDVAKQTLPDGTKSAGVLSGVHRLTQVWLEQ